MSKKLGICVATFENWKTKHVEFLAHLREGQAPVDVEIENALYKKAKGYSFEDVVVTTVKTEDDDGNVTETTTEKRITHHIPPDTVAQKFWLMNRRRKKWRDKQVVEHEGSVVNINIEKDDKDL